MIPKKSRLTKIALFYQKKLLSNIDNYKPEQYNDDKLPLPKLKKRLKAIVDDEEKFSQFLNRMAFYYMTDYSLGTASTSSNTKNHTFFSSKVAMEKMTGITHRKFTVVLGCTLKDLEEKNYKDLKEKNYKEGLIEELKDKFTFIANSKKIVTKFFREVPKLNHVSENIRINSHSEESPHTQITNTYLKPF